MAKITLECPECRLSGRVDEERLRRAGMKFRCPQCRAVHRVADPASDSESAAASAAAAAQAVPPSAAARGTDGLAERPASSQSATNAEAEIDAAIRSWETPLAEIPIADDVATPPRAAAAATPSAPCCLLFHGRGGPLFGILLKNMLLSLLTLGFYRFWGKVRMRQYLYGQTEILGDRLLYHGTGKELLVGWFKAVSVLFVGFMLLKGLEILHPAFVILTNLGFLIVLGFAKVGSLRYRLSRTSLRSIRFSFRGGYKKGLGLFLGGSLLTILTLGLYYPLFHTRMLRFWFANSHYGTTPFSYTGRGRQLFGRYLLTLLLIPFTFGLSWFWFKAAMDRYDWEHTSFPGVRFVSTITGGGLFKLEMTNLLLLILTLGLAMPWVLIRALNFRFRHLTISGQPDFSRISQDVQAAQATGEGLADYMDMDFGLLDFGIF